MFLMAHKTERSAGWEEHCGFSPWHAEASLAHSASSRETFPVSRNQGLDPDAVPVLHYLHEIERALCDCPLPQYSF